MQIPWRREWKPTPVFLPEYSLWGHKELDTSEQLTLSLCTWESCLTSMNFDDLTCTSHTDCKQLFSTVEASGISWVGFQKNQPQFSTTSLEFSLHACLWSSYQTEVGSTQPPMSPSFLCPLLPALTTPYLPLYSHHWYSCSSLIRLDTWHEPGALGHAGRSDRSHHENNGTSLLTPRT